MQNTFKAELIKHAHHKYELCVRGDVAEPTGNAGNIVTTHHVKYDENPAKVEYTEATIERAFTIPVHHVAHAA